VSEPTVFRDGSHSDKAAQQAAELVRGRKCQHVIPSREGIESGSRNVRGQIAAGFEGHKLIGCPMHHEGRNMRLLKQCDNISLRVWGEKAEHGAWRKAETGLDQLVRHITGPRL
jgi:hypothetical protein